MVSPHRAIASAFFLKVLFFSLMSLVTSTPSALGQSNADYSAVPPFVGTAVPPNILFVVDLSEAMLPAAYGFYPLSYYAPGIGATYASNYNGTGFTVTDPNDSFIASKTYFGMFDSLGCYTATNSQFASRTPKALVTDSCANTQWDGNFLNWLAMRKIDLAKKVLIGGRTVSASNLDGTANSLLGEPKTGQAGSTNTCNSTSKPCYRYVKFVPTLFLAGRVPSSLDADTASFSAGSEAPGTISTLSTSVTGAGTRFTTQFQAGDSFKAGGVTRTVQSVTDDTHLTLTSAFASNLAAGTVYYGPGRYFGSGEGTLYVNNDTTADPFCSGCRYPIQADLTAESTAYRQAQSMGLLQNMSTTNKRVAVMFTNSSNGVAATLFRPFDGNFNASAITNIRNQPLSSYAALAEGTYEALCYYRNSQGPCFNNNPADFAASVGAQGDPFFFTSMNQFVSCCKSFIVMISSGQPSQDANNNPNPAPFGNLFSSLDTIGLSSTRLDDVALYGQTHDIRDQPAGTLGALSGTQNVTFYAVNAMGGAAGAGVLASAAKFGGFVDRDGNGLPNATGQSCTYPAGSSLGSGTSTSSPEWDVDQDCVPDTYFEASDGSVLETQINYAIVSILKRAASGTSSSVLASTTTGEGVTYQAYFFPATTKVVGTSESTVTWTGYLQGLFVDQYGNLREDFSEPGCTGPPDGKLVLKHDCIIKVRFDTTTNSVLVDRYKDDNGDGVADTSAPFETVALQDVQPIWEGGRRLALTDPGDTCAANTGGVTCRRILTWVDLNNNGLLEANEQVEFTPTASSAATLCPYLGGVNVLTCVSGGAGGAGQTEATNIINWIRGNQISSLRDRQLDVVDDNGATTTKVWKLGDIIYSTPVVVGAPSERYDTIYGDATYAAFYRRYKDRRQVVYVGANDGMLHAFNGGFFSVGDDASTVGITEQVRFTLTPKQPGTSTDCGTLPCDGSAPAYTYRSNSPKLGAELWGFIPQDLLPQLQWLTSPSYSHVYYVDLKPKITDARIFAADDDHPGGWGTVLIGGFRMGGSCSSCLNGGGETRVVTADFDGNGNTISPGDTRAFLSSYFVLDITNPEKDPVLLWTFRDMDLGFTTSMPAVLRVNPAADARTSSTNEKWYVVFGTGPSTYAGVANGNSSSAKLFVVDLKQGPTYKAVNQTTGTVNGHSCGTVAGPSNPPCIAADTSNGNNQVRAFDTGKHYAFMGDVMTLDLDLDFRVDVIYAGVTICNGSVPSADCVAPSAPTWKGALYRLTTNKGNPDPSTWGLSSAPTALISTFPYTSPQATTCSAASPCPVGPITSAPIPTMDASNNLWLFFGTGRFYSTVDGNNTNIQHFFGVKDSFMTQGSPAQTTERNNLYNVSNVTICATCASTANVSYNGGATYTGGFNSGSGDLVGNIQNVDGWFTTLPSSGEQNLSRATLLGGSVYFTTFVPSLDICVATGTGYLYGLYYLTGTPYTTPALGTSGMVGNALNRSISLEGGLPSPMALQIGGKGAGQGGSASNGGCAGRVTGFVQTSNGVLGQVCTPPSSEPIWSRMLAWRDL